MSSIGYGCPYLPFTLSAPEAGACSIRKRGRAGQPAGSRPGTGRLRSVLRITTRNARFQEWQALLANRRKRQRAGEFVVQGVRPVTLAVRHGWPIRALIYDADRPLSAWAQSIRPS